MSRVVSKRYALDYCMSKMARENHENNEIYIHDLDSYAVGMHNCLSIPFDDLLANGFNTRQTDVRPAQSISTAFQLVAVIFQIQSLQQFGGVSATH
ncbi:MAG: anaerobic ribonucleoside-triphosphate reductase [Streptococcus sp.]